MKVLKLRGIQEAGLKPEPPEKAELADVACDTAESALVARCRAGDRLAWKALYGAHFDFVYRSSRRLGAAPAEIEDVCQEVFLVAYRRLPSFKRGRFSSWLFGIAHKVVSGRHRRRRVREGLQRLFGGGNAEPPVTVQTPERALETKRAEEAVRTVLARMAPKKRVVFALYELEGLSGEEIAERLGCKVQTVWTRLYHARRDFRRIADKRGFLS